MSNLSVQLTAKESLLRSKCFSRPRLIIDAILLECRDVTPQMPQLARSCAPHSPAYNCATFIAYDLLDGVGPESMRDNQKATVCAVKTSPCTFAVVGMKLKYPISVLNRDISLKSQELVVPLICGQAVIHLPAATIECATSRHNKMSSGRAALIRTL